MLQLHNLPSLVKKRKRVGRGGSRGGTSGKGHKGQRARSGGKARVSVEGGQMPLYRRLPKRGFTNVQFATRYEIVSLERIDSNFNEGDVVTLDILRQKGIIKKDGLLKVLGADKFSKKLTIHASAFSKSAIEAIQRVGGKVELIKES